MAIVRLFGGRALYNLQKDLMTYQRLCARGIARDEAVEKCLMARIRRLGIDTHLHPELPDWLEGLQMHLDLEIHSHNQNMATTRLQVWKQMFSRERDPHLARAYKFIKEAMGKPLRAVRTEDGFTTNLAEMDALLRHTWLKLCLPKGRDLSDCQDAFCQMDVTVPQAQHDLPRLQATTLMHYAKKMGQPQSPRIVFLEDR